ncbi:unnamed protein product [Coregonus sp. 'balchen']|nr:unnamed protein product [Coregonus sp. 'balchen']
MSLPSTAEPVPKNEGRGRGEEFDRQPFGYEPGGTAAPLPTVIIHGVNLPPECCLIGLNHIPVLEIKSAGKLPIFLRQPQTIRVISYKNGTRQTSAKVTASDITTLLEECTSKLKLNSAARRIFLSDGIEVFLAEDLANDSEVFVSMGEAFLEPQREIRGMEPQAKPTALLSSIGESG